MIVAPSRRNAPRAIARPRDGPGQRAKTATVGGGEWGVKAWRTAVAVSCSTMPRRRFRVVVPALCLLSLLLSVAMSWVWWRSYRIHGRVGYLAADGRYTLHAWRGRLLISGPPPNGPDDETARKPAARMSNDELDIIPSAQQRHDGSSNYEVFVTHRHGQGLALFRVRVAVRPSSGERPRLRLAAAAASIGGSRKVFRSRRGAGPLVVVHPSATMGRHRGAGGGAEQSTRSGGDSTSPQARRIARRRGDGLRRFPADPLPRPRPHSRSAEPVRYNTRRRAGRRPHRCLRCGHGRRTRFLARLVGRGGLVRTPFALCCPLRAPPASVVRLPPPTGNRPSSAHAARIVPSVRV